MDREQMINDLCTNLVLMNRHKVGKTTSREELEAFVERERQRYSAMPDLELKNIYLINFM